MNSVVPFFVAFVLAFSSVGSTPISGIARDVKSDLLLLDRIRGNNRISSGAAAVQNSRQASNNRLKVPAGEALDLFYRYGFFSLSVRVVPREDAGAWLIREPTASIFQKDSLQERTLPGPNQLDQQFQVFFCDDVSELLEAYFRDFTAEGIEQPHKLFTGSWHKSTKSKYLGLSKDAFDGESSFVLVKLPKKRSIVQIPATPVLKPEAESAIRKVRVGDSDSVLDFVRNYGSHYIKDVVVGDLIYQVFALTSDQYASAKSGYSRSFPTSSATSADFATFYKSYLAPWNVRETGKIGVASGDIDVFRFTEEELQISGQFGTYPNIFRLQENSALIDRLETLTAGTSAIVGLNFASLRPWVPDIQTREYYDEIIDTQAALWEANL